MSNNSKNVVYHFEKLGFFDLLDIAHWKIVFLIDKPIFF